MSEAEDYPELSPPPEEGHDPDDPTRPEVEEEDAAPTPPLGDPYLDTEVAEADEDQPDATEQPAEEAMPPPQEDDDDESDLSEIDEAQFENFDPNALTIEERPADLDQDNVNAIGKFKRKRSEGEEGDKPKKKKRRDRPKKKKRDHDDGFSGGEEIQGKRRRKPISGVDGEKRERPRQRAKSPDADENLTPQERARKELDRKMDESLKNPNRRRGRATGIDLEALNDDLIDNMRRRMAAAAEGDIEARKNGEPAGRKLKMLPEVVSLLNRNNLRDALVDPENNMMEGVRFFLEPLDDGSLPAFNIQREMFLSLQRLPINKDTLAASGIGKVVLFYTKSRKVEDTIKRQAEKLMGEWTRPILKRSDDFRKRQVEARAYDPRQLPRATGAETNAQRKAAERARKLATPNPINRARVDTFLPSYTVAPQNNVSNIRSQYTTQASDLTFKRLKARQVAGSNVRR
ncbi:MAG: hypothetical protein Q9162_001260 [Coniocarpon cinnabarinum]